VIIQSDLKNGDPDQKIRPLTMGCKVVMETRMKQAGMRWSRPRAQAMLALRSVLLSGRWDHVWPSLIPVFQLT
jgi:hypothetical protein